MDKTFLATLMIIAAAQTAQAQVTVDVSKITCEQFNVMQKADTVAIWLGGYYHGQRNVSVVDVDKFQDNVRNFRAACRLPDNFKKPVMQLIESNMPQ
jgi:hypothetical protein